MKRGVWRALASVVACLLFVVPGVANAQSTSGCKELSGVTSLSHAVTLADCGIVDIGSSLKIASHGNLTIINTTLRFTETAAPLMLDVQDGGALHLEQSRVEGAEGTGLNIEFRHGSRGTLRGTTLENYDTLQIAAGAVYDLRNVSLRNARTAIRVHEQTSLTLNDVTTTAVGTALDAGRGSVVRVVNSTLAASDESITAAADAHVILEGTPLGPVSLNDSARLDVSWYVKVNVTSNTGALVSLRFQDASGRFQAEESVPPNATRLRLLLAESRDGTRVEDFSPYRIIAVRGANATHATVALRDDVSVQLQVPDDVDRLAPVWPKNSALRLVDSLPPYARGAGVTLEWPAADDTREAADANRAVGSYYVLVGSTRATGPIWGTQFTLRDVPDGWHQIRLEAVDLVGNVATLGPLDVLVDRTAPTIAIEPSPSREAGHPGGVNVSIRAEDSGWQPSGIASLRWRLDQGPTSRIEPSARDHIGPEHVYAQVNISSSGIQVLHVTAVDVAGNRAEASVEVVIDETQPAISVSLEPALPTGAWHATPPTLEVSLAEAGPSGPGGIRWRFAGSSDWIVYEHPVELDIPGEQIVEIEAADGAGNIARTSIRVAYDPAPPVLTLEQDGELADGGWFTTPVTLQATAHDNESWVAALDYRLASGVWRGLEPPLVIARSGVHLMSVRASDAAGHETVKPLRVAIDLDPPVPPQAKWSTLRDGRVRAEWSDAPAFDSASGLSVLRIERATRDERILETTALPLNSTWYVFEGLTPGEHRFRIAVADAAGHESASPWATVRAAVHFDGTPAEATEHARGTLSVLPNGSLATLREVRYYIDGELRAVTATPPFAFTWETNEVENGLHKLEIVAMDTSGTYHQETRAYQVRNGYVAALADDALAALLALGLSLVGATSATRGVTKWRQARPTTALSTLSARWPLVRQLTMRRRVQMAVQSGFLVFFIILVSAAAATPLLLDARHVLVRAWWLIAAAATAALAGQIYTMRGLPYHERLLADPPALAIAPTGARIDFDQAWRERKEGSQ